MLQVGIVIVGDEILSGKRQDTHLPFMIEALKQRGLELSWARVVGDETRLLTQTFRETANSGAVVFSFGGIGATPDDITRQCAAEAFDRPITRHPEVARFFEQKFGADAYPMRIRMADLPGGCELIPNPVNQVPGFSVEDHHFVPGFPSMSHPMVEWVLDTHYAQHFASTPLVEARYNVLRTPESDLIPIMESLLEKYPSMRISCLPSTKIRGALVDLGLKAEPETVAQASEELKAWMNQQGIPYEAIPCETTSSETGDDDTQTS
ncbi:MAG: competence/damage-inducible protein A [bacterium]